jgi:hypothetical protein
MPIYIFKHPKKEQYKEVFQEMNAEHVFFDEGGIKWNRVYTVPNFSIDARVDPYNIKELAEKTRNKKGTLGEMVDYAKEMSERRGGEEHDPIVKKRNMEYKKKNGVEHPSEKIIRSKKKLKNLGIRVEK